MKKPSLTKDLDFDKLQQAFTRSIRNQNANEVPYRIMPDKMLVYQQLIYHNLSNIFSNAFPVIYSILSADSWKGMIQDFILNHGATTQLFHEIPKEFVQYLLKDPPISKEFTFLGELAHYEYIEIMLELAHGDIPVMKQSLSLEEKGNQANKNWLTRIFHKF